jgi:hypothetical protein
MFSLRRRGRTVEEYDRLTAVYLSLGYEIHTLPKISASARADWIQASLAR